MLILLSPFVSPAANPGDDLRTKVGRAGKERFKKETGETEICAAKKKKKKKKREPAFVHAPAPDKPDVYLGLHTPYMQASSLSARESSRGAEAMRGLSPPPSGL